MKKEKNNLSGITLIALVVTIVVLLILAGITINFLMRGNSVLSQAQNARVQNKLGEIDDQAKLIYSDLVIKKQLGEVEKITLLDIVTKLRKQGYEIEARELNADAISAIVANPSKLNIVKDETAKVKISFDGLSDGYLYYALVEGKYYKINMDSKTLEVEREASNPEGTAATTTLEVATGYDTNIVSNVAINENEITITGGTGEGNTTITIKYGKLTTTLEVNIVPKVTKITAKDLTITENTSEKIEVTIEPTDAEANLSYTTTDTDKITVDSSGTVTAKEFFSNGKLIEKVIVTIKDEKTGITGTCNVTIENSTVGKYIEYDVGYTDMDNDVPYTKSNGWRLLNYTKNSDGTYSDVELISTGIPAELYYHYTDNHTASSNGWWEESTMRLDSFKRLLGGTEYMFRPNVGYSAYPAMRAAAGLYYNFGSIKYKYGTSKGTANEGNYKSIKNVNKTYAASTNATGEQLFKVDGVASSVRTLTLPEINKALGRTDIDSMDAITTKEDTKGIYRLDQVTKVPGIASISNSSADNYWIASPYPGLSYAEYLPNCNPTNGSLGNSRAFNSSIRPVVSLQGSKFQLKAVGSEGTYRMEKVS